MKSSRKQIAALPWRRREGRIEVLLITSRESGRWLIPKGGRMTGLSDGNAALQEAFEEAGVKGTIGRPIGEYHYVNTEGVLCDVKVFPMRVKAELQHWPEEGQRERRWVELDEAASAPSHPELAALLAELKKEDLADA